MIAAVRDDLQDFRPFQFVSETPTTTLRNITFGSPSRSVVVKLTNTNEGSITCRVRAKVNDNGFLWFSDGTDAVAETVQLRKQGQVRFILFTSMLDQPRFLWTLSFW